MNNPQVIRGYVQMIRNSEIEVVKDLRKNITEQANDHPKFEQLEQLFKERLGE
jgi:hypothetical protein